MRNVLLALLLAISSLNAGHVVKATRSSKKISYHLAHTRALIVYSYAGKLTTGETAVLHDVCTRTPFCYLECRALAVPFCAPCAVSDAGPGTAVVFWDGQRVPGQPFSGELTVERLYDYVMQQMGDSALALVRELGLDIRYHDRQRSTGNSWYFGGYYSAWGAYPAWGSQPWGAFSLGMGFRRPQN